MDMWLTDTDIEAVLGGEVPPGRPELADLGAALELLREEFPPQPVACSAELAAMLDGTGVRDVPTIAAVPVHRRMLRWAAGLGVAGQAALASTGAAAAIGVGGLTGVLPEPAQRVFDDIVRGQETPPAIAPPPPATPGKASSRDDQDRREASSREAPTDRRPSEPRHTSRDLTVDGTRRPSGPATSTSTGHAPPATRNTEDAGRDQPSSGAPVAPKKPTTPAQEPDDDLDDHKDDLKDAEDDHRDRVEQDIEDAEDRAEESGDTAQEPQRHRGLSTDGAGPPETEAD